MLRVVMAAVEGTLYYTWILAVVFWPCPQSEFPFSCLPLFSIFPVVHPFSMPPMRRSTPLSFVCLLYSLASFWDLVFRRRRWSDFSFFFLYISDLLSGMESKHVLSIWSYINPSTTWIVPHCPRHAHVWPRKTIHRPYQCDYYEECEYFYPAFCPTGLSRLHLCAMRRVLVFFHTLTLTLSLIIIVDLTLTFRFVPLCCNRCEWSWCEYTSRNFHRRAPALRYILFFCSPAPRRYTNWICRGEQMYWSFEGDNGNRHVLV